MIMTKTKIGINGFGRIGRLVFRAMLDRDDMDIVAINNPSGAETAAYLLKYDTIHGRLDREVIVDGDSLLIDGKRIVVFHDRDPANLDWSSLGIQIIVESTGKIKDKESASKHIKGTVLLHRLRMKMLLLLWGLMKKYIILKQITFYLMHPVQRIV